MRPAPLLAAVLLLLSARTPAAEEVPFLAEEVVAVVETRAVLLSELEVEARLMRAQDDGPGTLTLPLEPAELRSALDRLIDRHVVFAEAERLQVFTLGAGEVDREIAALQARMGPERLAAFLAAWDVDERTLRDIVQRDLRVGRYLEGRFKLAAKPREADLAAYWKAHLEEFRGQTFEQAAPEIRQGLQRRKYQALAQGFVADVRKRARVRMLRDFEAPGSESPKSGTAAAAEVGRRTGG
jgi:hypothetical protein